MICLLFRIQGQFSNSSNSLNSRYGINYDFNFSLVLVRQIASLLFTQPIGSFENIISYLLCYYTTGWSLLFSRDNAFIHKIALQVSQQKIVRRFIHTFLCGIFFTSHKSEFQEHRHSKLFPYIPF